MVRATSLRAVSWIALAACAWSTLFGNAALGQTVAWPPTGQPTWIGPQPTFQVGPNGAVNLDQAQPYTAAQVPPATYPPAATYPTQQFMAQPYAAQPFGAQPVIQQPIGQQPAWGAPFMPQTNVGGSIPYFFLHRTSLFGEFLYMRPRDAEVAYALPISTDALPLFNPVGPVATVEPDYDYAFRVGGNWAVSDGNSIAAQYTRLESEASSQVAAGGLTVLLPLVTLPLPPPILEFENAAADQTLDLEVIDLDFRGLWAGCECNNYAYAVNYLAGAEYATLDQTFAASYVFQEGGEFPDFSSAVVNSSIDFDGIGMRFGLQGERFFPNSGLFVYGNGITNILFGEFDATFQQTVVPDFDADPVNSFTSWSAGRVVPVVELELGAGWLGMNRHLRLSAGYRVSSWFNMVKTEDWIWAVQNNDFRDMSGTLTFDGVVGRAEWLF